MATTSSENELGNSPIFIKIYKNSMQFLLPKILSACVNQQDILWKDVTR